MTIFKIITRDKLTMAAFLVVAIYLAMAVGTEIYSFYCFKAKITPAYAIENMINRYSTPSLQHWMGTDYLGRDVFLRAVAGTATAVKVGVIASFLAAFLGVFLGALGGFYGGKVDQVIVWLYSTFASMPTLLFILAFSLLVSKGFLSPEIARKVDSFSKTFHAEPGMLAIYLAIGLTGWVTLCRVVRAETMKLKSMAYVDSARVAGQKSLTILFRHIVPNLFHLVIIYFTLRFAYAIMTEVIVSYLGMGIQSAPSWGVMISDGQERLWRGIWWEVAGATVFMFFLVLSLNILGDSLRDSLDPKQQKN